MDWDEEKATLGLVRRNYLKALSSRQWQAVPAGRCVGRPAAEPPLPHRCAAGMGGPERLLLRRRHRRLAGAVPVARGRAQGRA